jgi:hypothetical protein
VSKSQPTRFYRAPKAPLAITPLTGHFAWASNNGTVAIRQISIVSDAINVCYMSWPLEESRWCPMASSPHISSSSVGCLIGQMCLQRSMPNSTPRAPQSHWTYSQFVRCIYTPVSDARSNIQRIISSEQKLPKTHQTRHHLSDAFHASVRCTLSCWASVRVSHQTHHEFVRCLRLLCLMQLNGFHLFPFFIPCAKVLTPKYIIYLCTWVNIFQTNFQGLDPNAPAWS